MMVSDVHLCDRDGVVLIYNYKKKKRNRDGMSARGITWWVAL